MGGYYDGYLQGQNVRMNSMKMKDYEQQQQLAEQNRMNRVLYQAMQMGQYSPELWDRAMERAASSGNTEASNFIGKWSPFGAQRLVQAYGGVIGGGGGDDDIAAVAAQPGAPQQPGGVRPPTAPKQGKSMSFNEQTMKAIEALTPEQRKKHARNYDYVLQQFEQRDPRTVEDVQAMLQDFQQKGILTPEDAEGYGAVIDGSSRGWQQLVKYRDHIASLRNHLDPYVQPGGIAPAPTAPEIEGAGYDSETGQMHWLETGPDGQVRPRFGGGGGGIGGVAPGGRPKMPSGLKEAFAIEQQSAQRFEQRVAPIVDAKRNMQYILNLDPNKTSALEELGALYSFVKALDPGSVVKEGEIAMVQQAQTLKDTILKFMGQATEKHILTPEILSQMQGATRKLLAMTRDGYDQRRAAQMRMLKPYEDYISMEAAVPNLWGGEVADPYAPPPKTQRTQQQAPRPNPMGLAIPGGPPPTPPGGY